MNELDLIRLQRLKIRKLKRENTTLKRRLKMNPAYRRIIARELYGTGRYSGLEIGRLLGVSKSQAYKDLSE